MTFASEVYLEDSIQKMEPARLREKILYLKKDSRKEALNDKDLNKYFESVHGSVAYAYADYIERGYILMCALFRAVDELIQIRLDENEEAEKFHNTFPREYVEENILQHYLTTLAHLFTANAWSLIVFAVSTYNQEVSFDNNVVLQRLCVMFRFFVNSKDFLAEYR